MELIIFLVPEYIILKFLEGFLNVIPVHSLIFLFGDDIFLYLSKN